MKQENHFSIVGPIPHSHSSAPKAGGTRRASAPAAAIGLAMLAISILGSTGVASGQEPKTWSEEEGVEEPKGEATIRGSVASTYSLGESMPFSVVAVNESSTRSPVTVEHPGTSTIALTLERIDGHVDERPIYEAVYDG
ncbi:MAG: hypothetical protein MI919_19760, partial [Holophagales bacterium]|nr:hypothetical protein [Holophagales bacterium]